MAPEKSTITTFKFPNNGNNASSNDVVLEVTLQLNTGFSGLDFQVSQQGLYLWPSAKPLAQYLVDHPGIVAGKRILELGAGVGLTSCVAAKLGPRLLIATDFDQDTLVRLGLNLRNNLAGTDFGDGDDNIGKGSIEIGTAILDWRTVIANTKLYEQDYEKRKELLREMAGVTEFNHDFGFDVLIGSDLFWDEEHVCLVVATVHELLLLSADGSRSGESGQEPKCIISFVERSSFVTDLFMHECAACGIRVNVLAQDAPLPVQISAKRWTKPQAVYVVQMSLMSTPQKQDE
ncbi:hypothetical protein BDR26DRAFT_103441 [Obelidium mucronatum]|nr:hypothetical protein BDR26DRAFT_103441 [Obelidium mucronatum]